ncbi:hypothetical protein CDAR_553451 [Caerostris darwini]|uniref:Uncharacterized protein n=1 Tax=Caerostris darwini TaxID=1538125 RepID=A0AAV4T8B1_9ARAC|nr:hypothetical protein CDAR_553451 [Caerostris darwini]
MAHHPSEHLPETLMTLFLHVSQRSAQPKMNQILKMAEDEDVLKILLATDCHLGYLEAMQLEVLIQL